MIRTRQTAALAALFAIAAPTVAAAAPMLYPVQVGEETARFFQGVATLDLESDSGAVQVTPLPLDHGSLSFRVAVYNKGRAPANFDGSNVTVTAGSQTLAVFSKDQLVRKAKTRAVWSQIGIAVLAGAAAAAASQAYTRDTYRSYTSTPYGAIRSVASWRDNSIGVIGATASVVGGGVAIAGVRNRLDYTVQHLTDEVAQMTTIDADASYAARIVVEKIKSVALPQDVRVTVNWNGHAYPFAFRLTKPGQDLPPPWAERALTAAAPPAPMLGPRDIPPAR